ncbi:unnamed protein product [Sphagnum troendelagicum]|uniref:Endonuclease/exonuclease/phosphatase domain-containing protein n=1 Tax=Sphagnum troendelagicum TaxID=128251 RepID=A0ABP0TKY7_9BRYO
MEPHGHSSPSAVFLACSAYEASSLNRYVQPADLCGGRRGVAGAGIAGGWRCEAPAWGGLADLAHLAAGIVLLLLLRSPLAFSLLQGGGYVVPPADKVVLLGDFNIELGGGWQSSNGVVGCHHLHHSDAYSNNRERLLDQAASFGLRVANTSSRTDLAIWAPGATLPPSAELCTLEHELSEAAGRVVGKAHPARRHKPGLTQATLVLVARKHQAHCAVPACP